ncbi:hypothetical protein PRJ39_14980 [Lysobacter enzymogenes]|uniref:beta strand repeat-containing protein n=1 Tax=Lysobacter enzymogenes TaxID=69 RepID=UPI0037485B7D
MKLDSVAPIGRDAGVATGVGLFQGDNTMESIRTAVARRAAHTGMTDAAGPQRATAAPRPAGSRYALLALLVLAGMVPFHAAQAQTTIFDETFSGGNASPTTTNPISINGYVGAPPENMTFTAGAAWSATGTCNGLVASWSQADNSPVGVAHCATFQSVWNNVQGLALALGAYDAGLVNGGTATSAGIAATQNLAMAAFTTNNPPAGSVIVENATPVPLGALPVGGSGRFVTFRFTASVMNCTHPIASPPNVSYVMNGTPLGGATDLCAGGLDKRTYAIPAKGAAAATTARVGTFYAGGNVSRLVTAPITLRVTNNTPTGTGNDWAWDNFTIVDVSPSVTKAVDGLDYVGQTKRLTFTVTNTAGDNGLKNGWAFTDTLPANVTVANPAGVTVGGSAGCSATTSGTVAGGNTIVVTGGNLPAGTAGGTATTCTIAVDVVSTVPGIYINNGGNFTSSTGLNVPTVDTQMEWVRNTVTVTKITQNGTGAFSFTNGNDTATGSLPYTITTTAAGAPGTAGPQRILTAASATATTTVSEAAVAGWAVTGTPACTVGGAALAGVAYTAGTRTLTLPALPVVTGGRDVQCSFINSRQTVTVVKSVTNDNGGNATAANFNIVFNGSAVSFGAPTGSAPTLTYSTNAIEVPVGTYALSEADVAGYTEGTWTCTGTGVTMNSTAFDNGSVTLADGASATCTITNDDTAAALTLRKTVVNDNGGTAVATAWTLNAAGPTPISGAHGAAAVTNAAVGAGTYTLSENGGPAGYTASAYSCSIDGGAAVAGNTLALGSGQSAVCTVTNDDTPATLTLQKTVVNDNGGTAVATAWTLNAAGPTPISGAHGAAAVTDAAVGAGTYTLSENGGPAGYTASAYSCSIDGGAAVVGDTLALVNGQNAVCTVTNDDTAATLTLQKTVVNDNGGTAVATAWTLNAAGPTPISGAHGAAAVTNAAVSAGTYTLSETGGPAGYAASAYSCSIDGGAAVAGNSLTLANGQSAVCAITNDDQPARLTLQKNVINDSGGTVQRTAWTLNAAGPTPISGTHGAAAVTNAAVTAGAYTLSETGPAGYNAGAWQCTNGVTVNGNSQITLANGATTSCTITNNDRPTVLSLLKTVVNDNGGTRVAANWTLRATGPSTISGAAPVLLRTVNPGTYTLSETGPGGYTASAWTCTGGLTVTGGNQVTVPTGFNGGCSITNNDQPAQLTLQKTVVNDNGGAAVATDWTLAAAGPTAISGAHGATTVTNATVSAGTYVLSENGGPAGYTASAYSCSINGGAAVAGNSLALANGQNAVCTITNDDTPATLTLQKTVVNDDGGTAVATAWTLNAAGPTQISGTHGAAAVTNVAVGAGTYTLSENGGPAGYAASDYSCSIDGGAAVAGNSVTLAGGQNAVCTVTNDDTPATLTLRKSVVNDNGGTAVATAWTLSAAGPTPISGAHGAAAVTDAAVGAGTYTLSESGGPAGYTASAYSCSIDGGAAVAGDSVTLANGQSAVCTVTNDDSNEADLSITKSNTYTPADPSDQAGDTVVAGAATTYTVVVTNNGPATVVGAVVRDTPQAGLDCPAANPVTCSGAACPGGAITVGDLGGGVTLGALAAGATATFAFSCAVQ